MIEKKWNVGEECWYIQGADIIQGQIYTISMYIDINKKYNFVYEVGNNGMKSQQDLNKIFKSKEEAKQYLLDYIQKL